MALLRANNVGKYFGERKLFSDITFEVQEDDRVGFVGVNGSGKTTLFRMLAGTESIDEGSVSISRDCRIALLAQAASAEGAPTLFDFVLSAFSDLMETERQLKALSERIDQGGDHLEKDVNRQAKLYEAYLADGGLTYRNRTRSALLGLGFAEAEFTKDPELMSGGEIRKAALARLLLSPANLLLLDEPTNHLDIAAVEWLEDFLKEYKGAFIVISHDRYFLDHVTNRTFELQNGRLTFSHGNYSRFVELKMDRREVAQRQYMNTQREIKRIEGIIEQQRRWNQERNYVTIASKEKQIARLKATLAPPEPLPESLRFRFRATEASGNEVLVGKGLSKEYDGQQVFHDVSFLVKKNEHVCLLGGNGCGKTTLLRVLTGREAPDTGTFLVGANVQVGYYEQRIENLNPENTVLDEVWNTFPRLEQQELRNTLGMFLFHGDDVFKRVGGLSGGERARIQLLKLMLAGCNLLLLDEPTNHLDIASREALENALSEYGGTMLIVTHDRYFVNKIADRILLLQKDGITEFAGDWDSYKQMIAEAKQAEEPETEVETPHVNDYVRAKEKRSAINRLRGEMTRLEREIAGYEAALSDAESALQDPENASDYEKAASLYASMKEIQAKIDTCYEAWMQYDGAFRELEEENAR